MRRAPLLVAGLTLALLLGACGGDDEPSSESSGTTSTEADGTSTTEGDDTTTIEEGTSTTDGAPTTLDPADLPGEALEIFPYDGAELAVVGVAADDTLNVRVGPGTDFEVVAELDPRADGLVATGHNRDIGDGGSLWVEVEVDGRVGWVNRSFVSEMTGTTDITSQLPSGLGGETVVDLAEAVAEARAGVEEGAGPKVIVVAGPTDGDRGEITVDVIGYQDDAVTGERLDITATPDARGEGFVLLQVDATTMCTRGVNEGLCL